MSLNSMKDISSRAQAEVDLWWNKQTRDPYSRFSWWYQETTAEHDGGFLIAQEKPANEKYYNAGELRRDMTKEQNLYKFLEMARGLPILAIERRL